MIKCVIFFVALTVYPIATLANTAEAPDIYIDKGACPFECCTYRDWTVNVNTILYKFSDEASPKIGVVKKGEVVQGLTGEVRTKGRKFLVHSTQGEFSPGDIIWVYTYLGEGFFKVWHNGGFFEMGLGFSPYGGSMGKRCEIGDYCWGELEQELSSTWWVKIKSKSGLEGWSNKADNFGHKDACGM